MFVSNVSKVDIDGEPRANPPSFGCDECRPGSDTGPLSVTINARFTIVSPRFEVPLSARITGRATPNRWEFGDGTVLSNRPAATHVWQSAGDYPVIVRAYNGAAIPPNLIALAHTESNSAHIRYCTERGLKPHPARFPCCRACSSPAI